MVGGRCRSEALTHRRYGLRLGLEGERARRGNPRSTASTGRARPSRPGPTAPDATPSRGPADRPGPSGTGPVDAPVACAATRPCCAATTADADAATSTPATSTATAGASAATSTATTGTAPPSAGASSSASQPWLHRPAGREPRLHGASHASPGHRRLPGASWPGSTRSGSDSLRGCTRAEEEEQGPDHRRRHRCGRPRRRRSVRGPQRR